MSRNLTLLGVALASLYAAPLRADDAVLGQMYGSGVHAYFSQDYVKAYDYLTSAIKGGSTDPRCYYFRGLAELKLGREPDAELDFAKGADLDSRDVDAFYNVARSLERIQGSTRLMIERYRVKGRLAALKHAEDVRRARYEATRAEEKRVLRPPIETVRGVPGEAVAQPSVQPVPKPGPEKPIPEDIFELNPAPQPQPEKTGVQPPKPPVEFPPAAKKPLAEPAIAPKGMQPTESPFATPPAGKKPVAEPAPGPTGGLPKSAGILGAVGKALGKAITGGRQLPSLRIGPGMQPDQGGDDPFKTEPKAGPPAKKPLARFPDALPKVPPGVPPKVPPATLPKVSPETPDNPFDDQPPGKPSNEPVAEPPAKSGGGPSAKPGERPSPGPGGGPSGGPPAEPAPEPPGSNPFGN